MEGCRFLTGIDAGSSPLGLGLSVCRQFATFSIRGSGREPLGMFRHLVPISTDRHGTPAPLPGARSIVEKQTALRIGADPDRSVRPFRNDFGCRPRDSGQKPLEALLTRHKLQSPVRGAPIGGR